MADLPSDASGTPSELAPPLVQELSLSDREDFGRVGDARRLPRASGLKRAQAAAGVERGLPQVAQPLHPLQNLLRAEAQVVTVSHFPQVIGAEASGTSLARSEYGAMTVRRSLFCAQSTSTGRVGCADRPRRQNGTPGSETHSHFGS